MELKKKIVIIDIADIANGTLFRNDILDIFKENNISRVVLVGNGHDRPFEKAVEMYVFTYCNVAVSTSHGEDVIDDLYDTLPHKICKTEYMIKVGGKEIEGIDYITIEELCK